MIAQFRLLNFHNLARTVFIALIGSWLVAFVFALGIAALQYAQVQAAFPPEQVMGEFQTRIAREFGHSLLLFLPQAGIMAGLLAWQILRREPNKSQPIFFGFVAGSLLAVVQAVVLLLMAESWFYIVALALLLIGAGAFAGWLAGSESES